MKINFFRVLKNIYFLIFTHKKFIFIFNYHQIYSKNKGEIIEELHHIKLSTFKTQLKIMSFLGSFISYNELIDYKLNSKINFIITFDDVHSSYKNVHQYLKKNSVPIIICPCYTITSKGYSWRNKVYQIIKYLEPNNIYKEVNRLQKKYQYLENDSFYKFTKSNNNNSIFIEKNIINKIFKKISKSHRRIIKNNYLTWEFLTKIKNQKNIEIANHSYNHYNMTTLNRSEVIKEFNNSDKKIRHSLKKQISCFAVPFGTVTENLLVDLTDVASIRGYKSILWVTNSANILSKRKEHQLYQLGRIHTPTNIIGFIKILILSFFRASDNIMSHAQVESKKFENNKINESKNKKRSIAIENLLRPNKDYASDPKYFDYLFNKNIYRSKRSHYIYVSNDERIDCLLYNFHAKFLFNGKKYNGVYWAGGRSLPFRKNKSNASIFVKSMQKEAIIGSYKPNKSFQKGLQNWLRITMYQINFRPNLNHKRQTPKKNIKINIQSSATKDLDKILEKNQKNIFFTLIRSSKYYAWRYDQYHYAQTKYFILVRNKIPTAFLVLQFKDNFFFVSDFSVSSMHDFESLLFEVVLLVNKTKKRLKNKLVSIETSNISIVKNIRKLFPIKLKKFSTYYYFNKKVFGKDQQKFKDKFEDFAINETQTSGDILLR